MNAHLPILQVLAPFIAAVLLLAMCDLPMAARRWIAVVSVLAQIAIASALLMAVAGGEILVYRLGGWPAPWGIVLVADQLAAWLMLTTTLLALFAVIHAGDGTDRQGRHFHVLFQMQLFGIAMAFLTGDLFNLFVAFEILLIASYGLLLHGGGAARVRAGLHYVILNLIGSTLFLFAAGLIYASLGTLNMADIARQAADSRAGKSRSRARRRAVAVRRVRSQGGAAAVVSLVARRLCPHHRAGGGAVRDHDQGRRLRAAARRYAAVRAGFRCARRALRSLASAAGAGDAGSRHDRCAGRAHLPALPPGW